MKIIFLFILLSSFLLGLDIDKAIDMAIKNSDKIREQSYLYAQAQSISKSKISTLMPKLDLGYIFSYNIPGNTSTYFLNSFNITGKYNVFNGFKDYYTIKDSKQSQTTQNYVLQSNIADVTLQTKIAYISVLQALDSLKIAQESKKLLEAQKQKAQQFFNQGFRAKNEVLSVEVLLANANIALKSAELNLDYSKNLLSTLTSSTINPENLENIKTVTDIVFDKNEILEKILQENPDYLRLQSLLKSAEFQVDIARGSFMPTVDVFATKFWYINGGSIARTSYALQSQARIVFGWNLFDGLNTHYNYQAKKFYYLSILSRINQYKKDMKNDINKVFNEFELAKQQYSLASVSLKQAEENYRITNNRYIQNIATYTELLNAQFLLNTAKTNIIQSKYETAIAVSKIDRLLNTNSIHSDTAIQK
ncbi:TolC family protein [Helicobacter cappadocius]|uniref:TolC family protein n=1 Tax=Helicobacter cappadocius TaxID=3063998 RepID=A0AA90TBZ2_9HELI|nr:MULTISPECIES: TolC family protein [unclassified Helicobacter]MDO7253435.1 TolC family protein [Helicobacter sp. faydin-H75]MDP2539301.1 TolC family protein [Helicobacter sp. faydin-H76]